MAKKYKRQVRKEAVSSIEQRPAAGASSPLASRAQSTSQPVFNPDYSYVIKDLRRIGLLAGTFISLLVILSFFLR
jgi:hypothetical protein